MRAQNGQLVGVEALLRWTHPTLGLVPPSEFIHIAEEAGLIRTIGAWVLQEACAQWMRWRRATGPGAQALGRTVMSVNLSAAQLADPQLVPDVQAVLARLGMPASALELEITESQLMDNAHAAQQQLAALKALGVHLSIDDFGTGYSSLAYLKRLPLYELKIDKSFVDDTPDDPNDTAIVQSIISVARHLNLRVVAEGVETRAQADFLVESQCECLQGYLFGRPEPLAAWVGRLIR